MSDMPLRPDTLAPLFQPASVCIVGASSDSNKIGGRPLHFLKQAGYGGRIFPVNPSSSTVQGLPSYRSIAAIPVEVNHAIIAVPAALVEAAFDDCAAKGVKAIQIFTAGFSEAGAAGKTVQDRLAQKAREQNIRLVGPNSLGLFSVQSGFFGTFATALDGAWPRPGSVALATQSGAFGSYAFGLAQARNLGFSHFIATGNESDVDVSECIAWFARDGSTKVILATFESVKSGARLIEALRLARAARVAVVAMKVGSSEAGAAAAASHTGSLAGADAIYDAVLRDEGAYRAHSIEEMIDIAYAVSHGVLPQGRRLGVVTTSGGIGVLLADVAGEHRLQLPVTPQPTQQEIKALLPFASPANPIDTSAQLMGDLSLFARILDLGLKGGQWDAVISFLAHIGRNKAHWAQLKDALFRVRAEHPEMPFVLAMLVDDDLRAELEGAGFLVFEEPVRAVRTLAATAQIAEGFRKSVRSTPSRNSAAASATQKAPLNEREAKRILKAAGIDCTEDGLARSGEEAAQLADAIGYPVVLKVVSSQITHKSDVGGVVLGIVSGEAAREAYDKIMASVASAAPAAEIEGVLVSPMIEGGVETILGVQRDPVFGPVVMFGLGGIFVEVFNDVSFRVAPFDEQTALEMIGEIKGVALLKGARGRPSVDIEALATTLSRLSAFADANRATIGSIDINPYIVLPSGGTAVDALVIND